MTTITMFLDIGEANVEIVEECGLDNLAHTMSRMVEETEALIEWFYSSEDDEDVEEARSDCDAGGAPRNWYVMSEDGGDVMPFSKHELDHLLGYGEFTDGARTTGLAEMIAHREIYFNEAGELVRRQPGIKVPVDIHAGLKEFKRSMHPQEALVMVKHYRDNESAGFTRAQVAMFVEGRGLNWDKTLGMVESGDIFYVHGEYGNELRISQ